ncbi:MAG: hypothetical protein CVU77_01125 [Elusimicrobia bacterium HGW-Elusimicrobia-1]|jgi:glycosyltransferase involved in cell wall biosynthesis|nr:MAG: hypothetical protein CVU77_01125 [Elusimicrobia bacterium HGW-Elusimicrobia-1]
MTDKKLSILSAADLISPDEAGGSGRAAWEISAELSRMGHAVSVVTRGVRGKSARENIGGIEVFRHFSNPAALIRLASSVGKDIPADVMIFHQPFTSRWFLRVARRIPAIAFHYSPWHEEYEIRCDDLGRGFARRTAGSFLRKMTERAVLKSASTVFTNSNFMRARLRQNHGIESEVLHLGVDTVKFSPSAEGDTRVAAVRKSSGVPTGGIMIFTLRNLVSRMGLENLIEAFAAVAKEFPSARLVIGGDGYLKDKLTALTADRCPAGSVTFAGRIPDNELPDYYRASDFFVLPTRMLEGFGLVTIEALSSGVPVLATPVGSNEEILGPLGGEFIFKSAEAASIAEGMARFIQSEDYKPPSLRNKCREYALSNFSWSACAKAVEKKLYEITGIK